MLDDPLALNMYDDTELWHEIAIPGRPWIVQVAPGTMSETAGPDSDKEVQVRPNRPWHSWPCDKVRKEKSR